MSNRAEKKRQKKLMRTGTQTHMVISGWIEFNRKKLWLEIFRENKNENLWLGQQK